MRALPVIVRVAIQPPTEVSSRSVIPLAWSATIRIDLCRQPWDLLDIAKPIPCWVHTGLWPASNAISSMQIPRCGNSVPYPRHAIPAIQTPTEGSSSRMDRPNVSVATDRPREASLGARSDYLRMRGSAVMDGLMEHLNSSSRGHARVTGSTTSAGPPGYLPRRGVRLARGAQATR